MGDLIVAQTGPYALIKRKTEHGWIVRTPLVSYHVMHNGERLCGSADVQRLRSELPHIAKWAALNINDYAASKAHMSKDSEYATHSN